MSVTGFQRRRRNVSLKEDIDILESKSNDLNLMTIKEIKALLDEKGIKYDSKEKKEELIKILKGAE
ncbi:MAG: HeH/LEM domain-containing protein [Clostridium sp.]|nr:HeH/LEM domain-containing protein [Clostridium sp.]